MSVFGGGLLIRTRRPVRRRVQSHYGGARRVGRPRIRTRLASRRHGRGFFGDLWGKVKDTITHPSRILNLIPHPYAKTAGGILGALGRGRRRRRVHRRRRVGGSIFSRLSSNCVPYRMASTSGMGRRRRYVRRRRRTTGGSIAALLRRITRKPIRRRRIHRRGRGVLLV